MKSQIATRNAPMQIQCGKRRERSEIKSRFGRTNLESIYYPILSYKWQRKRLFKSVKEVHNDSKSRGSVLKTRKERTHRHQLMQLFQILLRQIIAFTE